MWKRQNPRENKLTTTRWHLCKVSCNLFTLSHKQIYIALEKMLRRMLLASEALATHIHLDKHFWKEYIKNTYTNHTSVILWGGRVIRCGVIMYTKNFSFSY